MAHLVLAVAFVSPVPTQFTTFVLKGYTLPLGPVLGANAAMSAARIEPVSAMIDFDNIADAQKLAQAIVNTIPGPFVVLDDRHRADVEPQHLIRGLGDTGAGSYGMRRPAHELANLHEAFLLGAVASRMPKERRSRNQDLPG